MKLKKTICGILASALLLGYTLSPETLPLSESAVITADAAETFGDFEYSVTYDQAVIVRYTGREKNVEIPQTIDGHKVVKIRGAFKNNDYIENVTIPDGVKIIGDESFSGCKYLKSVRFPKTLNKIGSFAFSDCIQLKSADLPKSVDEIGVQAFNNCLKMERVTLPDGITQIGEQTFYNCVNLLRADIPQSVVSIGDSAFMYCGKLAKVNLPEKLEYLGKFAFTGCTKLVSITIPETITEIDTVFEQCSGLRTAYIPKTVTKINKYAFFECDDLVIYGEESSYAESFAKYRGYPFKTGQPPIRKPAAPSMVRASKNADGEAKITWNTVGNADGYEICMAGSKDGEFIHIKTLEDYQKKSFIKTGLNEGKTYHFKMRSYILVNGTKYYSSYSPVVKIKV